MKKLFLAVACAVFLSSSANALGVRSCASIFGDTNHAAVNTLVPDSSPAGTTRDIVLYLQTLSVENGAVAVPVSTKDALSYFARKIEPYQGLLNQAQASVDWEQELAELRHLLKLHDQIVANLAPGLFHRLTKRRGLHRLNASEVEAFFKATDAYLTKKHDIFDMIDAQERDFIDLSHTLALLHDQLQPIPDRILKSKIQESMKPALIAYVSRKIEMLNAQRAVIEAKLPSFAQLRANYMTNTVALENFIAIHGEDVRRRLKISSPSNSIEAREFGNTYARVKEILDPILKKKNPEYHETALLSVIRRYPSEEPIYRELIQTAKITAFEGTKVKIVSDGKTESMNVDDIFFEDSILVPNLPYSVGEIIYRPKKDKLSKITAVRSNGDVAVEYTYYVAADEMAEVFFEKNFASFRYKIKEHYFIEAIGAFTVIALRPDGTAAVKSENGYHEVPRSEMLRARLIK